MRRYKPTYFIAQAFKGLWRNGVMTLASVTVLLSCLIVMGCFSLLLVNIEKNLSSIGDLNEIVVLVYSDKTYVENDERVLPDDITVENNDLLGWSTDPNDTTPEYVAGQTYIVDPLDAKAGKITLYAVWQNRSEISEIKVFTEYSGISLSSEPEQDENTYKIGDKLTLPSAPVSKNPSIKFLGWSLDPNGLGGTIDGGEFIIGKDDVKAGKITLYAIWNQMPVFTEYSIVYDANGVSVENMPTDASLRLDHVRTQLEGLKNISKDGITFISKEQTLEEEKENYKDYPGLQSFLSDSVNPFPDTFLVSYENNSQVDALELQIQSIDGVDKVRCRADIAESIENLKNGVIIVFSWFMVILFVVSIFVIINTVKLAVAYRSKEITIMRYIGATKWFIALPFILEGVIIGIFSGIISFFVQWYAYGYVHKMVMADLNMITIVPFSDIRGLLLIGCILVGVMTGIIGSGISIRKNLKA